MTSTNINKSFRATVAVFCVTTLFVLSGCSDAPKAPAKATTVQSVKLMKVMDSPDSTKRVFPAEVSAVKTIDVSFEVSGRLISTNLLTSSLVKKGDVLAQIDPTPFNQLVDEASARFAQADRDLKRISSTFDKGLASLSEFDSAKTNFELAEIALQRSKKDLSYTRLISPFDAQISERLVDNGSYVKSGDIIARLQDVSRYYFKINVPERLVSSYQQGTSLIADAYIISAPEKRYALEYIEHDTQPDPVTQTYKVVFAAALNHGSLTPGARAVVNITLGDHSYGDGLLVPFSSLIGNDNEGFKVWRFNPSSQIVEAVLVDVLHVEQDYALVKSPLTIHDSVVAAGANKMREGLAVKPYQSER